MLVDDFWCVLNGVLATKQPPTGTMWLIIISDANRMSVMRGLPLDEL